VSIAGLLPHCCTLSIPNGVGGALERSVCVLVSARGIAVVECSREVVTLCGVRCITTAWVNVAPLLVAPVRLFACRFLLRRSRLKIKASGRAWLLVNLA